ncbi:NUDIX domain-containing protein [Citreimonas salinaria]|uniref:ADP-ribose pyrophosphatase n=1 Tax=Citreimonas salinaria TaxID=321339 RepID=A0A1H3G5F8_9RHOB|nr:NUDIX domain-containing protein [Citreimonas salinaria]SDX98300.1 nudix-type nucleoside diphosphatase, YffH/AdpP family [Citreimonas salinaria]
MTDVVFYGTLRHPPLLERVLGRAPTGLLPARIPDHAVHWVADQPFPMIRTAPGTAAEALLLRGATDEDVARLDFYEGGFAYDLREVEVEVETHGAATRAVVYMPREGHWTPGPSWALDEWLHDWGAITMDAAAEVMDRYGRQPVEQVQALLPMFRARAWSRRLAQAGAPSTLRRAPGEGDLDLRLRDDGYDGFMRLRRFDLRHRTFDGNWSETLTRETLVSFDVALVLPYDPATDTVLLVEQVRYGPLMRGDPAPWVLEPVAGFVDAGELPEVAARRETREEAGLDLAELIPMVRTYSSPGYSTEFFHFFLGLCDLKGRDRALGGLVEENEDIRSHVIPFDDAMALMDSGEVNAAPLAMMLLWLARHREGLRASA